MAIFKLRTTISDSIFKTAETDVNTISTTVSSFDPSYVSDVDVAWTVTIDDLISNISESIGISADRVGNIVDAIGNVNTNHNRLQNSLKFTAPYVMGYTETHTPKNSTPSSYGEDSYPYGMSGAYSASGGGLSVMDPLSEFNSEEDEFADDLDQEIEVLEDEEIQEEEEENIEKELTIDTIAFMGMEKFLSNLEKDGTLEKILSQYSISSENPLIVEDSKGYARLDASAIPKKERPTDVDIVGKENRYLVVCSSDVGQVGEVLRFKNGDDVIECVVAYNDNSAGKESTMTFVVAEDKFQEESSKVMEELLSGVDEYSHIENKTFDRVDNLCNMRVLESGTRV